MIAPTVGCSVLLYPGPCVNPPGVDVVAMCNIENDMYGQSSCFSLGVSPPLSQREAVSPTTPLASVSQIDGTAEIVKMDRATFSGFGSGFGSWRLRRP